jgi:acyl-CoA dehydrogenase
MAYKSSLLGVFASVAAADIPFVRNIIKKMILKGFGTVSETQKIALDAGTAKHEGEFFSGQPDWEKLDNLPVPALSQTAQDLLSGPAQQLPDYINDWEIRNSDRQDLSPEAWQFLKENKFFGLMIKKEYEGLGLSAYDHAEIVARIGTFTLPGALTVMVPNSLGPGELIHLYGTQAQKDHYLPRLAKGVDVPCFGLTEAHAGSDAASIQTTGVVFRDENGDAQIKINGEKRYITLSGDVGTLIGLAIRLKDPENILGKGEEPGITCMLVPRDMDDKTIDVYRHRPMDIPFQNGQIFLKDVVVPADNIIGGADMAGEGWRMLMECLGIGRSISLPANSASSGKRTSYAVGAYAAVRKQFDFPLADMKGLHKDLAKCAGLTYMIEASRTAMALRVDDGERPAIGSAILKVQTTEAMAEIIEAGMRIQGGNAIIQGPRNFMGMMPQGEYVARTVEGDNNMTQSVVIFGQGSKKGHAFLTDEIAAAESGDNKAFAKILKTHTKDVLDNMKTARSFGKSGGGGDVPSYADEKTAEYFRRINRISAAFNFSANLSMGVLGGAIQFEQPTSMRLGQVYSSMMMAYYTLWHFHKVHNSDEAFRPLVEYAVGLKLQQAEEALQDMIDNYPVKDKAQRQAIQWLLKRSIFPKGMKYKKPSDDLNTEVANSITRPGKVRDWMRSGMIVPNDKTEVINHLEQAFEFIHSKEAPVLAKLKETLDRPSFKALMADGPMGLPANAEKSGVLSAEEVDILKKAAQFRDEVVEVDYFDPKKMRSTDPVNKLTP